MKESTHIARQWLIGRFRLANEFILVLVWPNQGDGEYYLCSDDGQLPRIKVGLSGTWSDVMTRLLHEATEVVFHRNHLVLQRMNDVAYDTGNRLFLMDHAQFAQAIAAVAQFLVEVTPFIKKAYDTRKRKSSNKRVSASAVKRKRKPMLRRGRVVTVVA